MKKIFLASLTVLTFVGCGEHNKNKTPFTVDGAYYGSVQTGTKTLVNVEKINPKTKQKETVSDAMGTPLQTTKVDVTGYLHRIIVIQNGVLSIVDFNNDLTKAHRVDFKFTRTKNILKYTDLNDACEYPEFAPIDVANMSKKAVKKYKKKLVFTEDNSPYVPMAPDVALTIIDKLQPQIAAPDCSLADQNIAPEKDLDVLNKHLVDLQKAIGPKTKINYQMVNHKPLSVFSPEFEGTGE